MTRRNAGLCSSSVFCCVIASKYLHILSEEQRERFEKLTEQGMYDDMANEYTSGKPNARFPVAIFGEYYV